MRRPAAIAIAIAMIGMLCACASARPLVDPPGAAPTPTETIVGGERYEDAPPGPGAFVVRYGQTELHLDPVTYCAAGGCVDGVDPDPPSVGSPDELLVFVPVASFDTLSVSQFSGGGDYCSGRWVQAVTTELGDGWWQVTPRGPAGDYRIELFAGGSGTGDMAATLRWTTPIDEPLPSVEASLALIADHDGAPDSYGLELAVSNLAETPTDAAATITVTAANGASMTFEAQRSSNECEAEGAVFFDGPDGPAKDAAALGGFPFAYDVELVLDGGRHTAHAVFPDDLIEEHGVAVALEFEPALP
ncbi:hypothetical protein ACFQRL_14965 [Microbacterium fluvii]|uniref:Bacterial spore germination immunoglobulin-like domain-containing protein n=1 Tax=Microbacterium fluvii TaxID=415215 RepID=A0ABW2HGI6_9MICO|nr:hypothetical protein [Microbacterium fluvii]MCU4673894.1 hypothetical protein [Microbacterium fluvii]